MKIFKDYALIAFIILLCSCNNTQVKKSTDTSENKMSLGEQPIFKVSKSLDSMVIDGKMNEASWQKTESRVFNYTYRAKKPTDTQQTTFRMLWDETNLYLFYQFEDAFLTARETERDGKPFFDDCAEIFLIPVPKSLDTHFGFELNMYKAMNDFLYFNAYYKDKNVALKTFNPNLRYEVGYVGTINDNSDIDQGWTVEIEIPIAVFGFLGEFEPVQPGNKWAFLAVRQDRNEIEGERRVTSTIFPIYDIDKDVHQPNRFGLMEFVEDEKKE